MGRTRKRRLSSNPCQEVNSAKVQKTVSTKSTSNDNSTFCCICHKSIVENAVNTRDEEGVYCEGRCQSWMHRRCAGLSTPIFAEISNNSEESEPFLCVYCVLYNQAAEIKKLKDSLNTILSCSSSQSSSANLSDNTAANDLQPQDRRSSQDNSDSDVRKRNAVIYGIDECATGTDKLERVKHDFCKVLDVCSAIDATRASGSAICDTVRLGKYSQGHRRPRPILVTFNSAVYVSSLLANKKCCPKGISLKPDLSPQARQTESLLLKERWQLIQKGCDRKSIRIRGSSILLDRKLYASVKNGEIHKDPNAENIMLSVTIQSTSNATDSSPDGQNLSTGSTATT